MKDGCAHKILDLNEVTLAFFIHDRLMVSIDISHISFFNSAVPVSEAFERRNPTHCRISISLFTSFLSCSNRSISMSSWAIC
jgi:hypothetical protein